MTTPFPTSHTEQPDNLLDATPQPNQGAQCAGNDDLAVHTTTRKTKGGVRMLVDDSGMSTIEYAMGSLAAAALAAALYLVVSSGGVTDAIESIITDALSDTPS